MEDVADEHKIAFDVFERESEEDGTVDISSLPDLLRMTNLVVTETFLSRQRKRLAEDGIERLDWNLFCGIYSAASGEVVAEDFLSEALKSLEVPKIFPDGTIGRKITTSDLREFLTTYGDDPLSDADVQELIQDTDKLLQGEVQADAMAMELIHTFRDL